MPKQAEEQIFHVRTRVRESLHAKAKIRAARDRVTMDALMNLALEAYLKGGAK